MKQQEENVDYPDGGMFGTSERHLWHDDSSHLDFCEEFFRVLLGNHCHLSFACRDISMLWPRAGGTILKLVGMEHCSLYAFAQYLIHSLFE